MVLNKGALQDENDFSSKLLGSTFNVKTLKFSFQLDQPFRGEEILQKIDGTVFFVDFSCR